MNFWLFAWLVGLFWFCGFCLFEGGVQPEKAGGKEEGVETDTFRIFQHLAKRQQKSHWKIVIQVILSISDLDISSAATVAT